jgi:hypothetical protein
MCSKKDAFLPVKERKRSSMLQNLLRKLEENSAMKHMTSAKARKCFHPYNEADPKKRELHGGKWIEIRCEGKADFYRQAIGSGAALNKGRKKAIRMASSSRFAWKIRCP